MAETKAIAELPFDAFVESYALKYAKAADCLNQDREALLAFYDFPAEHWKHLRTTNPIEKHLRYCAPSHDPIEGLPVQQDRARDGLQTARGRAEKLASSRWPQPVAKTRSRCDINDGIEVIAKPTDRHPVTAAA
jgi:putative transposase